MYSPDFAQRKCQVSPGRMTLPGEYASTFAVEGLPEADVEHTEHDRVDAVLWMLVRHQLRSARHLHPDHIGSRFGGMADHDGQACTRRKRRKRLPLDVLGQDHPELVLVRLMFVGHGAIPSRWSARPASRPA